jgi:hypothetical protein
MSSKNYKIACIPADGIGPEVIDAGVKVLEALSTASKSFTLDFEHYDWSSETYKKTGKYIPDNGLEDLKKHDAIFFGAVGAPGEFKRSPWLEDEPRLMQECRCTRPRLTLESSSSNLPGFPAIRKRASNKDPSWYRVAPPQSNDW